MLYQCVDSGFHLTVNTVVRSGEVVWFDFASSTVDFTLNSGPVVEWINSFSQVSLKNPGLKKPPAFLGTRNPKGIRVKGAGYGLDGTG